MQIPPLPSPPDHFNADATLKWREVWVRLDHEHRFDWNRDYDVLVMYCAAYADLRRAERSLNNSSGLLVDQKNHFYQSPFVAMRDNAAKRMNDLAVQLGLRIDSPVNVRFQWEDNRRILLGKDGDGE